MDDENDNILDKAKAGALRLISGNDTNPKGMGDVQKSDEQSRLLPVMQQGYNSEEDQNIADTLQNQNRQLARQLPMQVQNVSPQDVQNTKDAIGAASIGTTFNSGQGIVNSLSNEQKMLDVIKNIPKTTENMPKIKAMLQSVYGKVKVIP